MCTVCSCIIPSYVHCMHWYSLQLCALYVPGDKDSHLYRQQSQTPESRGVALHDCLLAVRGLRVRHVDWAGKYTDCWWSSCVPCQLGRYVYRIFEFAMLIRQVSTPTVRIFMFAIFVFDMLIGQASALTDTGLHVCHVKEKLFRLPREVILSRGSLADDMFPLCVLLTSARCTYATL